MTFDPGEVQTLDLQSVDTVLSTARSVRRQLDFARPVEPEVILDCIDVATQAPTGLGGESWRFVVVTDDGRKRSIAELYRSVLLELVEARAVPLKPTQQSLIDRLHIRWPSGISHQYHYIPTNLDVEVREPVVTVAPSSSAPATVQEGTVLALNMVLQNHTAVTQQAFHFLTINVAGFSLVFPVASSSLPGSGGFVRKR